MTSVTLFNNINIETPKSKNPFSKTTYSNEPTEEEILNHKIAINTPLPFDDFDEDPFGHSNLGMDDDTQIPSSPRTEAQHAGPPAAIWLPLEEYSESENEFLTESIQPNHK